QTLRIVIEAFGGHVLRVGTGVNKDYIRVKIEDLQTRTVECKASKVESGCPSHDVEMVGIIGRDLHDLMRLPEWAQAGNQRQLVAAIVLEAESMVEREQRGIVIETVGTQPFSLWRERKRSRNDMGVDLLIGERRLATVNHGRLPEAITVPPEVGVQPALVAG